MEKRTESSAGVGLQLRLPQHADQHGPERPILLAVDQAFREDARSGGRSGEMDEFDPMERGTPALRFLSALW